MRTRFAPSPTGFLHVGGLRTAFFAWLLAKKTGGSFFLRIEDTDQTREVDGAVETIVRTLCASGIPPDEGVLLDASGAITERGEYGPYFQSKRLALYRQYADQLLASGHAYHCFCTAERLDAMRKKQQELKQAPMYDRCCTHLSDEEVQTRIASGEKYVLRMRIPREEAIHYHDEIYGDLTFQGHTIDDQVLLKSDGFPTYHLAHVVDDHLMNTDIVIRGEEWLSSLPKHLLLFKWLGFDVPKYAHVPLLLNKDRSKLSKRQNDVAAEDYLEKGYLPEALLNFLVLLGWNPGTTQEIFSIEELINSFSLDRIQKSGAIFDTEKLNWLQGQWMRKIPLNDFVNRIRPLVSALYSDATNDSQFHSRAALIQERITFFSEAPEMMGYFYAEPTIDLSIVCSSKQKVTKDDLPAIVTLLRTTLDAIPENEWSHTSIQQALEATIPTSGFKKGQVLWPLRALLTGREYSPGAYEVAGLLPKELVLGRIQRCDNSLS